MCVCSVPSSPNISFLFKPLLATNLLPSAMACHNLAVCGLGTELEPVQAGASGQLFTVVFSRVPAQHNE